MEKPWVYILAVFIPFLATVLIEAEDVEYHLKCENDKVVASKDFGAIEKSCKEENIYTTENGSCIIQCMMMKKNLVEDNIPDKDKIEKYIDEKVHPDARVEFKKKALLCYGSASKIEPKDCSTSEYFDNCMIKAQAEMCQTRGYRIRTNQ